MATVGSGKYTYELVEDWAKLPEGWTLGQTAIVTDSEDRVYLFNRSEHPLIVLDKDGNFLTSWGEGVLTAAHGMFIDGDENIYLPVINSHVVLKYSSSGNLLMTLGLGTSPLTPVGRAMRRIQSSGLPDPSIGLATWPFRQTETYISPTATATPASIGSPETGS